MAQQYYSMDQMAKVAEVSANQIYYLINMKLKLKPTLVDPSGQKFYDEHALGKIFQDLGKKMPQKKLSSNSLAVKDGLLDIDAIADTTGFSKKKLKTFIREHKEIKPDFVDKKNHNKKFWGPKSVQYIQDHFSESISNVPEEKSKEVANKTINVQPTVKVEKDEDAKSKSNEDVVLESDLDKKTQKADKEVTKSDKKETVSVEKNGPRFVKKAPRPEKEIDTDKKVDERIVKKDMPEKITKHPAVELPFNNLDDEDTKENVQNSEVEEKTEKQKSSELKKTSENSHQFVVRKRERSHHSRNRGTDNRRVNNYKRNNNYNNHRELFVGKLKLVTEKGVFYTEQFEDLDHLAEFIMSAHEGDFMKVERYNRGHFVPAYISAKSVIEFEEA